MTGPTREAQIGRHSVPRRHGIGAERGAALFNRSACEYARDGILSRYQGGIADNMYKNAAGFALLRKR